ncbi:MAG TPA: hypothetical protein VNC78_12255 [Actinomycetota bacterium]|nr:hypothetical protein [Actinomycetota bacterium]
MRTVAAIVGRTIVVFGLLLALAGPASAQQPIGRDPFDPVVSADQGGDGAIGEVTGEIDPVVPGTVTETEPLPTTGAEPRSWLALAYILVALGAGTLLVTRVMTLPPQRALPRNDTR